MPFGPGHLTKRGRQLEFSLGQYLRRRYVAGEGASPLLGPEYFTGAVRVNTSAVERTQESAAAFLAGLFPPGRAQDWETDGSGLGERWLPIPYHIVPEDQDRALIGSAPCPAKDADVQRVYDDPGYRRRVLDALGGPDVLHYIRTRAGLPERGLSGGLYQVFSNLQCQEDLHLTLPEWSRPVYPEPLRSAANLWLKAFSYTPRLRRLSFGDLTTGVLHAARTHGQQPRLLAYSAHDSTLAAALQAFHLEPQDPAGDGIPEFSACLLFELHRDAAGTLGLQIFYRREPGGPLVRMIPEGCGAFCPLDALEAMMQAHGELPQPGDDCDDVGDVGDVGAEAAGRLADVHLGHVRGVVVGGL